MKRLLLLPILLSICIKCFSQKGTMFYGEAMRQNCQMFVMNLKHKGLKEIDKNYLYGSTDIFPMCEILIEPETIDTTKRLQNGRKVETVTLTFKPKKKNDKITAIQRFNEINDILNKNYGDITAETKNKEKSFFKEMEKTLWYHENRICIGIMRVDHRDYSSLKKGEFMYMTIVTYYSLPVTED